MSILRQIDFGDAQPLIEKRSNALNHIEAHAGDILPTQPIQNLPALKGNWKFAQVPDRKIYVA